MCSETTALQNGNLNYIYIGLSTTGIMGDFTERSLREMINGYNIAVKNNTAKNTFIELEIKTHDNPRDVFERVYAGVRTDTTFTNGRLELSANAISDNVYEKNSGKPDTTSYIRKFVFNGETTTNEYYRKTSLASPVRISDFIKYSVTLSQEVIGEKFASSSDALLRFKMRASFDFTHNGHSWRLDITAVKRGLLNEMSKGNLGMIKEQLGLNKLTVDNFLNTLNHNLIDTYEIEIEYVGGATDLTPSDITGAAKKIFGLVNHQYLEQMAYREEIAAVAAYIMPKSALSRYQQEDITLKQLVTQAIPITRNKYISDIYPMDGYLLTIKADGERGIVIVDSRARVLTTGLVSVPCDETPLTIGDCEILTGTRNRIRIFDVCVVDNVNVSGVGIEKRVTHIDRCVEIVSKALPDWDVFAAKYTVASKDTLEADLRAVYDAKYDHEVDGIIASKPGDTYKDTLNYKWKPYELNTIDFLAVKCPDSMLGPIPYEVVAGKTLYLLFVGISHTYREQLGMGLLAKYKQMFQASSSYYPIQFSPSYDPLAYIYYDADPNLHHKIVELSLSLSLETKDKPTWKFHRIRDDRKMSATYYGNNFRTAELTYLNYIDKFPFDQLYNPAGAYFEANAAGIHSAPNKYKRWIISNVFKNNLYAAKWVIDLAAGRGADLNRYKEIKVSHVLFVDVDATAISELISRKFTARPKQQIKRGAGNQPLDLEKIITKDVRGMTIHTLVADLKTPSDDLIARTYQYGLNTGIVDGIVCNFALHYMCDSVENLRNLLIFVSRMLKRGGVFYVSVMNGKAIFDLLSTINYGESWIVRENDVPKYELKKMYDDKKLAKTGQYIHVRLPFTAELVPEPLCNIENLITEAARVGLSVEINDNMASHLDKFSKLDRNIYDQLTADDKQYIGLFSSLTFRLTK